MSIYDNESKIYPDLSPNAPQEPQTFRLKKLPEIKVFFLDEIDACERIAKKIKRFNMITGIVDTGLITSTLITGGISIPAFASGVGSPARSALGGASLLFSLATVITQSKLDSIANIISYAMQEEDISPTEFQKILQEIEKYRKLKADIRNQAKAKVKEITKEKREELLDQGRKEGKGDFLRKIANTSGIQGVSAI